ncbi:hypothetical protein [Bradyrhizobium sp. CCBAU 65884]|uniref:hypothetical protein n=1 Tax=Bradyrhizobium sp. CCBAU 65884 TaxID=722477 RepID=UPI0023053197|nr:hypothetical protein [Bradyrhizobium sp. CCBAU 65884]
MALEPAITADISKAVQRWVGIDGTAINTDQATVIPDLASLYLASATAPRSRRAVQLGPGMLAAFPLFDGTMKPTHPAEGQRRRDRSDAPRERSEFTKNKRKSSGHGTAL